MILPIGFAEWLWLAAKIVLAVAPPSLLIWLWREMTAHSLSLFVQRVGISDGLAEYQVIVQNNEDTPLAAHDLTINILDDGGFVPDPEVHAGCSRFKANRESPTQWRLT